MTDSELEEFLDDISNCFAAGDFELWRRRTRIPLCLILANGNKYIRSEAELLRNFEDCITAMKIQRIDTIFRRPLSHEESEGGSILATYETHILSEGYRVVEPYESAVILQRTHTGIQACSILNAVCSSLNFRPTFAAPFASNQPPAIGPRRNIH